MANSYETETDLKKTSNEIYNIEHELGVDLANKGLHGLAISKFEKAIEINPKRSRAIFGKGKSLFELGCIEEALECFHQVINIKPSCKTAYLYKGKALIKMGKYNEAIEHFDEILKLYPDCSETHLEKGRALSKLGEYEKAINEYNQVIKRDKYNYVVITLKGIALDKMNRFEDAIREFEKAADINPDYEKAFMCKTNTISRIVSAIDNINPYSLDIKGKDLASQGKYDDAIGQYDLALQFDHKYFGASYNKGKALLSVHKAEDAIICFDSAIAYIKASLYEIYNDKAKALIQLNRYNEAIDELDLSISTYGQCWETHFLKGKALYELEEYTEAIKNFNSAITLHPDCYDAYYYKGSIFQKQKLYDKAIEQFDIAISKRPDHSELYLAKSKLLYTLEKYEEVIKLFDKVIELKQYDDNILISKGKILYKLKKYGEAISQYDEFIKISLQRIKTHELESKALKEQANHIEGEKEMEKAKEVRKKLYEPYFLKGEALRKLGLYKNALNCFDFSIKLKNNFIGAHINKALCLILEQKYEDAKQAFETALELNPESYTANFFYGNTIALIADTTSKNDGNYNFAIVYFDKAIKIDRKMYCPHVAKGIVLNKLGRYEEAIKEFDNALAINSNLSSAYYNKYLALQSLNKVNDAAKAERNAKRINPNLCHDDETSLLKNDSNPFNGYL